MTKLLAQMLRFPLTVFASTMEAFVNGTREIQKATDQTIGAMGGRVASTDSHLTGGVIADDASKATLKEGSKMSDQGLGRADVKYVSYSILFKKADLEDTLEQQE